jgi:hypothetical protein
MNGYPEPATLARPLLYTESPPHSSGQDVTIAYPKKENRKRRTILLEINSRDRNVKQYPNPSQFRWRLFRPLKDIVSLQISGGSIPARLYNINTGWNKFTFIESNVRFNITIDPGTYNYQSLALAIGNAITKVNGNSYSVQFSTTTGRMIITRNQGNPVPFGLLFETGDFVDLYDQNNTLTLINSPAHLWGFGKKDYYSVDGVLTSPYSADIDFLLNRVYVFLNAENNSDIATIERGVGRIQPHAIIYMDECCNNYKFLNKESFEPNFVSYPAPIARMATLDVSLRDEFDRCIDLNGRDFTLLLEVVYLD